MPEINALTSAQGWPHPPARRLIAVGSITRRGGRTITVRATEAGVTGSITPSGGAR